MQRELIFSLSKKDFKIQTYRGSGAGGQHRNKTDSAVRIIHRESGAIAECCEQRYQHQNKKIAFKKLTESKTFKIWLNRRIWEIQQEETLEQKVDKAMKPENLKVEEI